MDTRSNHKKNNKEANQATKDFENCEKWPALSPQTSMDKSEELLEKLSQLNSKMSGLESIPNQVSNLASTLKTVSVDMEQLLKEIKGLREENNSLREKNQLLENKVSYLEFHINDLEQYGTRQNLEIQGIPMSDNESNAETESKVLTVLKKLMKIYHMMILVLLTDWVNQKQTKPPTLLLDLSLEEPETIFIKKGGN